MSPVIGPKYWLKIRKKVPFASPSWPFASVQHTTIFPLFNFVILGLYYMPEWLLGTNTSALKQVAKSISIIIIFLITVPLLLTT